MSRVCAVICAAGKGERAGFAKNKLLQNIGGETVLAKTISAFAIAEVDEILIAHSPADLADVQAIAAAFPQAKLVTGGESRSRSVFNALCATDCEIVLIHDGARPFVRRETIVGCIRSVKEHGSGICAVPCTDTVAVCADGKILSVPDRTTLRRMQTPQGFFRTDILSAYRQAIADGRTYTDDSSVYAAYCGKPVLCDGDEDNRKLTYASDFAECNTTTSCPADKENNPLQKVARCGFGVDTHAFGKPQPYIVLAGVQIPSDSGLIAHSDGDVLVHAVMDALLSAAGLRDIGYYFPDTDEKYRNADSMEMLRAVVQMLDERGLRASNLSVAIQAEKPRMAKYICAMQRALAAALGIDESRVGVSAGTNEGLGYIGEGKGITVNAYVLLCERDSEKK